MYLFIYTDCIEKKIQYSYRYPTIENDFIVQNLKRISLINHRAATTMESNYELMIFIVYMSNTINNEDEYIRYCSIEYLRQQVNYAFIEEIRRSLL